MRNVRSDRSYRLLVAFLALLAASAACSSSTTADIVADDPPTEALPSTPEVPDQPDPGARVDDVPEAFVPAGPVGDAAGYTALIRALEPTIAADMRDRVPWPDTRNSDPVQAQLDIFELWIWMAEHHPEPALAAIMAVEGSPARQEIAGVFGEMKAADELHIREQAPYEAFDHRVVTLETAGLPLWLARGAPAGSVVVYYQDRSGPTTIRDRPTREVLGMIGEAPTRQWVSIIAPTDVGWLLYRDQLIEPGDPELEVPNPGPPRDDPERRLPEV